nr:hypothetical protein [Streptomyces sp. SID4926]
MSIRPPDGGRPGTPGEYGPFEPPASYGTPVPDGAPLPYGSPALYVPRAARELAALAVVVPAHDEEALLPHALAALRRAARHPALPVRARVRVVVVADACADATAA